MSAAAVAAIMLASANASPTPVDAAKRAVTTEYLFSFGDSYTDTGFVPGGVHPACNNSMGNPPFPGHTTSGGVNWIGEMVQSAPSCFLEWNFAYSGATVNSSIVAPYTPGIPDMITQVKSFQSGVGAHVPQYPWNASNAAAAIWFGVNDSGNDFRAANETAILQADISSYFGRLGVLHAAGVRRFLLLNAPHHVFRVTPATTNGMGIALDRAPNFADQSSSVASVIKTNIQIWNTQFKKSATEWASDHADSSVKILNTHSIFENILNNPAEYGAKDATCYNSDGTTCLWWNDYHPGQAIQRAVGDAAFKKLYGETASADAEVEDEN